jgi:hypothetical protein
MSWARRDLAEVDEELPLRPKLFDLLKHHRRGYLRCPLLVSATLSDV